MMTNPLKKLFVKTYGCQMNVYDSDRMVHLMHPLGYSLTETPEDADLIILNTCHIREKAEHKVFSDLGRFHQHQRNRQMEEGQEQIIVVAGCVAQAQGHEIFAHAPYVSIVVGPQTYHRLPEMVSEILSSPKNQRRRRILDTDFPRESKFDYLETGETSSVSAFLAIQEGCDKFCTFCCVPYTRGAEFSRPVDDIVCEASALVGGGAREITLLGQNVNAYHGASLHGEQGLGDLIFALKGIEDLKRIRYTTSHPRDMNDDRLYQAHRDIPSLMPFVHLPVQSGSDRILSDMNRKHTVAEYRAIISKFKDFCSAIAFSSDFIVGFPGETEDDFQATLDLVRHVSYAQAYSFKYSPRPGTPAALRLDQIPDEVASERLQRLQKLIQEQQLTFNQTFIGKTIPVLFDRSGRREGQILGKSPWMQSVWVQGDIRFLGKILDVTITEAQLNSISGKVV